MLGARDAVAGEDWDGEMDAEAEANGRESPVGGDRNTQVRSYCGCCSCRCFGRHDEAGDSGVDIWDADSGDRSWRVQERSASGTRQGCDCSPSRIWGMVRGYVWDHVQNLVDILLFGTGSDGKCCAAVCRIYFGMASSTAACNSPSPTRSLLSHRLLPPTFHIRACAQMMMEYLQACGGPYLLF